MAAAAPSDRLSDLPDDLLIHVLSFAPSREAARTTALSRRWRRPHPLWLHTAALNLDYRSYTTTTPTGGVPLRWRAMDNADHAIAFQNSVGRGPKKVAVVMRDGTMHDDILSAACGSWEDDDEDEDEDEDEDDGEDGEASGVEVEELRLECLDYGGPRHCTHAALSQWSYYGLSLSLLPFAALRTLELTGCKLKGRRCVLDFPCLEAMRLRRCVVALDTLQNMVDAAPRLSDLRLDALSFMQDRPLYRLRCPAVTVLSMANFHEFAETDMYSGGCCSIELDAPRLRRFRYTQVVTIDGTTFSFKTPTVHLEQVHLELHSSAAKQLRRSILAATRHARVLKLTAYSMADLGTADLPVFPNLERLDIEELCGWCLTDRDAAVTALFNLLRGCPAVRELRLKFSSREYLRDPADQMAAAASAMSECSYERLDDQLSAFPPGATAPECLPRSLRRVVVRFDGQLGLTCFQARLIKYFARNAQLLEEEVVVDGGRGYAYDASRCVHCKVAGCRPPESTARWPEERWPLRVRPVRIEGGEWRCCSRRRLWAASAILEALARGPPAALSLWSLSQFPPLGTPAHRRWRRVCPADIGSVDVASIRRQRPQRSAASCHRRSIASHGRPNMGRRR